MTHYAYWLRGASFVEMARMSIDSVRRVDPKAHIHIWTDDPGNTPRVVDTAFHILPSGRPAMVANIDAQIAALNYLQRGDRVLFLDADILMRKPFPWSGWADLYVTWRDHVKHNPDLEDFVKLQPYNYGVVGARVCPETHEAFLWMRHRVLQMAQLKQQWYGNQLALGDLVGLPPKEGQADKEVRVRWSLTDPGVTVLNVRQLPCEIWNFTPADIGEDVSEKGILHLKGDRKDLMRAYSEAA